MVLFSGFTLIITYILYIYKKILKYRPVIDKFLYRCWIFLKDWRNALSFGIAWLITNGWGWIFMFLGRILRIKWMKIAGDAYIAFLWIPGINEKVVTVALTAFIKKIFFKKNKPLF